MMLLDATRHGDASLRVMMNEMQQVYAPPQQPANRNHGTLPGPTVALYQPNQIGLATFVGTALGGGILLAINEARLGRKSAAWKAVLLSALATAALLGIAFLLPENFPAFPLAIAPLLVMRAIAVKRQQDLVNAHLAAGGKSASSWAAAGIGLASLVGVMVPVFVIAVISALLQG
jgi:hypothetical protein